jgi:hypothetical protein
MKGASDSGLSRMPPSGRDESAADRTAVASASGSTRPKRAGGERQVPGNPIRLWASYPRIYRFYVLA